MGFTLDGKTLANVDGFVEKTEVVFTDKDAWKSGAYAREVTVYGTVRTWLLTVSEWDVQWVNSNAKYFQGVAKNGDPVNFTVTEPPHDINLNVYILDLQVKYNPLEPGRRIYKLLLMEKM